MGMNVSPGSSRTLIKLMTSVITIVAEHQLSAKGEFITMLTSLAFIFLVGLSLAAICQALKLPRIIGMLITGILLGPYVLNVLDPSILSISSELRQIALIIILLKAGLSESCRSEESGTSCHHDGLHSCNFRNPGLLCWHRIFWELPDWKRL
ncbi:MAG: cation:proton antiporter [Blautia marasmi]